MDLRYIRLQEETSLDSLFYACVYLNSLLTYFHSFIRAKHGRRDERIEILVLQRILISFLFCSLFTFLLILISEVIRVLFQEKHFILQTIGPASRRSHMQWYVE